MPFRSTFYLRISLHFKDIDWSFITLHLWEVYYYLPLLNRETEAQQKELICLDPHSIIVNELGLGMSSPDGLDVHTNFVLPCSCLPLQSQTSSPELPGDLGNTRGALSQTAVTARQAATLSAHSEQFWACMDKSHCPRWDLSSNSPIPGPPAFIGKGTQQSERKTPHSSPITLALHSVTAVLEKYRTFPEINKKCFWGLEQKL